MSIIQDQQLIESLSDQDLARLIQGEIPQLAHLAPVGVSETTSRLDFRREYEEELARLDQPQENIATQLAQKLIQQGVPTVNQGVTDEFPQGGIAGPQPLNKLLLHRRRLRKLHQRLHQRQGLFPEWLLVDL